MNDNNYIELMKYNNININIVYYKFKVKKI